MSTSISTSIICRFGSLYVFLRRLSSVFVHVLFGRFQRSCQLRLKSPEPDMTALWTRADLRWVTGTLRRTRIPAPLSSTFCLNVQLCTGPPNPVIPSKKPFKVDLVGGKRHSWCTCGHSKKQPFCDGAHKLKAKSFTPLRFVPEKDTTAWLCGCKYTNNPPYCDGTHKQPFIVSAPLHEDRDS